MKDVAWLKLYSIVRLIAVVVLIIFAHYVSDHEAEGVERLDEAFTFSSGINKLIFEGFVKWDSVHYLNIAQKGYQNDYQFVFYPLYPLLLRYFGKIVLFTHFNSFEHILFFALLLNQILGLCNLILLRRILQILQFNYKLIDFASLCFIFNPAFIFFFTVYTESVYTFLSFLYFYCILSKRNFFFSSFILFLCCCTRSNGLLAILPFGISFLAACYERRRVEVERLWTIITTAAVAITPYILFSHVGYEFICSEDKWSRLHRDYCVDSEANSINKLRLYNVLQQKYWNVSFLNSYQIRQIPNMMLALPVIAISAYTLISCNDKDRDLVLVSSNTTFSHNSLLSWKIHLFVHLLIGLFWAHIQVSTRLILSSSPLIYVGLAKLLTSKGKTRSLIIAYLIIYMMMGSILHTNYYPWT